MRSTIIILLVVFLSSCQGGVKKQTQEPKTSSLVDLKAKIELALIDDQNIRKEYYENKDPSMVMKINARMGAIDSVNQILALEFLNTHGWPKKSEVGKKVSDGIFYIIQHADAVTMKKYLPQFKAMAAIGEASKTKCAMMTDRVLMDEGKKQIYGTQAAPMKDENGHITEEYFIWPIQNPDSVNILRAALGFMNTVEEYADDIQASY